MTKIFLILLAVVVIGGAAYFGATYFLSAPDTEPGLLPGRIEGSTNYPSDSIPVQVVCAIPVDGGEELCTETLPGDTEALSPVWGINVPAGRYFIAARVKDPAELGSDLGDHRAYYTQYVLCGMKFECKDHAKVPVVVGSGQTVKSITPYDWYTD